jgi:hypothetical protein
MVNNPFITWGNRKEALDTTTATVLPSLVVLVNLDISK